MASERSRARWAEFLDLSVDPASDRPLFQQIYLALREAIVAHALRPGSRLPSTRELAERLGVSRTSVLSAYMQLLAEGYVEGQPGSGTYVAQDVPAPIAAADANADDAPAAASADRTPSRLAQRSLRLDLPARAVLPVPFNTGVCAVDASTVEAWRKVSARWLRTLDPANLGYTDPQGEPALRRQVADYLHAARAVRCSPEQVLITSGAQQAIDLSLRVLLDPGDRVWVEDPGYLPTRSAIIAAGAELCPVRVDESGIVVGEGIAHHPHARAAYVTPSHQYPSGAVLSMARRLELLNWARETGAWIIEDDYDSEYRYVGRPLASLQGLDAAARVIYVGTLSKVLFPGVRIGFAVLPSDLVPAFVAVRMLADRQPPTFQQNVVAQFMADGFLTGHIRRMRQMYREAGMTLAHILAARLGDLVEVEPPECGMQLLVRLRAPLRDTDVAEQARAAGIVTRPLSPMYLAQEPQQGLLLGFTGFDPHRLRAAAHNLAEVIQRAALRAAPERARARA